MEFWGVELKPAQTLKVEPGENKYLHLSQVSLGEIKDNAKESILVYVKFNGQKLVLATLSADKCAQIQCDLIFEKEFELSIGSKGASVYLTGYKTLAVDDEFSDSDDSEESDEDIPLQKANGEPVVKAGQAKPDSGKPNAAKAKPKAEEQKGGKQKQNEDSDDDEFDDDDDDDDEESDEDESDDEDMAEAGDDSEDEGSSDEEDEATVKNAKPSNKRKAAVEDDSTDEKDEATVKNAKPSQKRKVDSALKTPITGKKSKIGAGESQKKGGAGKKDDNSGKKSDKAKHQSPKSAGSVTCKSCSKTFNSDNALQAHAKAKHGASK